MFNMGLTEIMVIAAIALVIFGPEKLPGMARTFGKYITDFKRTLNGVKSTIHEEIDNNMGSEMGEVNKLKNTFNTGIRGRNVEDILNTAADVLESSKPDAPNPKEASAQKSLPESSEKNQTNG